ncbi:MAG: radical SAM protein [Bacteroidales bacterium]|nr:radical SAM protein [Bacteroidales bacterium]MCF8404048.1 radical SAM protein [Bacteroidales bacterium]
MTFLFEDIIFGPVKSRRFGVSLGVNLLPVNFKYCTFNCIYCECGWTQKKQSEKIKLPTRDEVKQSLQHKLQAMKEGGDAPDNITFAGNGEPTIHPEFDGIIDDTIELRNLYFPKAKVTVLSNATLLHKKKVFAALNKVDNNVLKLDSVIEETFQAINQPASSIKVKTIIEQIKRFDGNQVIQTLFMRGVFDGKKIDNTKDVEVNAWLKVLKDINPQYVMIYPVERDTAAEGIEKIPKHELRVIADKVEKAGIKTKVYF